MSNFSLKIRILDGKFFVKSLILNENFFAMSDFVVKFLQRVRFYINFLNTRQFLNWIFYDASDFGCASFAICQVFISWLKQDNVWMYGVCSVSQVILLG